MAGRRDLRITNTEPLLLGNAPSPKQISFCAQHRLLAREKFIFHFVLHHRMFWANSLNRHPKSRSMIPSKDCTILEHWTSTRYLSQDIGVIDLACSFKMAGYWPSSLMRVKENDFYNSCSGYNYYDTHPQPAQFPQPEQLNGQKTKTPFSISLIFLWKNEH